MKKYFVMLLALMACVAAKSDDGSVSGGYPVANFALTVNVSEEGDMFGRILRNTGKLGGWLQDCGAVNLRVEKNGSSRNLSQFGFRDVKRSFPEVNATYSGSDLISSELKVKTFCPLAVNDEELSSLPVLMVEAECSNPSNLSETFCLTLAPDSALCAGVSGGKSAEGFSYAAAPGFFAGADVAALWDGSELRIPVELKAGEKKKIRMLISFYDPTWVSANRFDSVESQARYAFRMWDVLGEKTRQFSAAIPSTGIEDIDMYLRWYMIPAVSLTRCTADGKILTLGYCELNPRDSYWTTWVHLVLFKDAERRMIEECLEAVTPAGKMPTTILPLIEREDDIDINAFLILRAARYFGYYHDKDLLAKDWPTLKRVMDWLVTRDTEGKGLPRQVSFWGDWKDVGGVSDREYSPFSCLIYLAALKHMMLMGEAVGDTAAVERYRSLFDKGHEVLNRDVKDGGMWNGNYYCQLWKGGEVNDKLLEDQTLGILFGVVPEERAAAIVDALDRMSLTPYGVAETYPYYPAEFGYAPGTYHNGAVWPWVSFMDAWARMRMGRMDSALDVIRRVGHADIVASGDWSANEHINSITGENLGFHIQGWSAALFGTVYFGMLHPGVLSDDAPASVSLPASSISPVGLTVENMTDPSVIEGKKPRFSWINSPADPSACGLSQTAFRIGVSSSKEKLAAADHDVWDSGEIIAPDSYLVDYCGGELADGTDYHWHVAVCDGDGRWSDWSSGARFSTPPAEIPGRWLAGKNLSYDFTLDKPVSAAHVYIAAMGYFELSVNGKKVSDDYFVPNFTNFTHRDRLAEYPIVIDNNFSGYRVMYLKYDVDSLLMAGNNRISVRLGDGFARSSTHWVCSYGEPRVLCSLEICHTDSTTRRVCTGEGWREHPSKIVMDGVYDGEIFDANVDESLSRAARIVDAPAGVLTPHMAPVDRIVERFRPVSLEKTGTRRWLVKFPEEISGWIALKGFTAPQGDTVKVVYHSESPQGVQMYVSDGQMADYAPRFTWFVFSEAEIEGLDSLGLSNLEAQAVSTDVRTSARFESSDSDVDRILKIWRRTQIDNMHGGVASDCPHRERSPYTGDGQCAMQTVLDYFDAAPFYRKWIRDMRDAQNPSTGYVPNGAPWQPGCGGGVAWGVAMSLMPWDYYVEYGDREELGVNYTAMTAQLDYMRRWETPEGTMFSKRANTGASEPLYWLNLGDWCAPGQLPPDELVHTFYYWMAADRCARAAKALGKKQEHKEYMAMRRRIGRAFTEKFFDRKAQSFGDFGGNVFALRMELPEKYRRAALAALEKEIVENHDGHIHTGIFASRFLFEVLAENGRADLAHSVMTAKGFPGYMHWLDQGATTMWENWNGADSHNHPMFGGGLTWLKKSLAGIKADESAPGWRHFTVAPADCAGMDTVCYTGRTPYGEIGVRYRRGENLTVIVPVGCSATVILPWEKGGKKHNVGQGRHEFSASASF